MVSCAGKFEGRYAGNGLGTITVTSEANRFRSAGRPATKITLRETGKPENDMPIDINNDGTLQTPMRGEIKKKGN
jgi:hypothetical protein